MNRIPALADIFDAQNVISIYLSRTPLYHSSGLSDLLGCNLFIKYENHQPICAFKVRGGINLLSRLSSEERQKGVVTASTGNHGQSVAYAAKEFGITATVVVPEMNNPDKVKAIERLGATIVFHGKDFDESREHAEHLAKTKSFRYVHSANEPYLIAGVGTIGLEILEDCPHAEYIFVAVGGGSGASGISIAAKAINPNVKVIGVQSEQAPAAYHSWKAGKPLSHDRMETFAEGLATRVGFEMTVEIMKKNLDDFILVPDSDIRHAMKLYLEHAHTLAEGAGAASLAGAMSMKDKLKDRTVVVVLSGANVTIPTLQTILHQ
ncbi:MAG TPA: threonine/serine dehydratase [Bacteroidota bacterium]